MVLSCLGNNDFVFHINFWCDKTEDAWLQSEQNANGHLFLLQKYKELKSGIKKKNIFPFNNSFE